MRVLEQLGVYGWSEIDENIMLASLLTGDPLLMVGSHGSAKSYVAAKLAKTLKRNFIAYDASKALFEDVLGFPDIRAMKKGKIDYLPSSVTVWNKDFILIDEINRALPELQSKWLEIIRSRKIMGIETGVKWVWAAMNPTGGIYSGAQTSDAAMLGRFAAFLYPPTALSMIEADRVKVLCHLNGEDAPAIEEWGYTKISTDSKHVKVDIESILELAATYFSDLRNIETIPNFLSKFVELLQIDSKSKIILDGRRLGFIYRLILATRAVEWSISTISNTPMRGLVDTARSAVMAGIPVGAFTASDLAAKNEHFGIVEASFNTLSDYIVGSDTSILDVIYKGLTDKSMVERIKTLVNPKLPDEYKARILGILYKDDDIIKRTIAAMSLYVLETRHPRTISDELLTSIQATIKDIGYGSEMNIKKIFPDFTNNNLNFIPSINELFNKADNNMMMRLLLLDEFHSLSTSSLSTSVITGVETRATQRLNEISTLKEVA